MTTHDDLDRTSPEFDRLMTAWFDAEARVHEPDDLLDRTISRTARTRPRPAWLLSERWIPMELTMRRVRSPRFTRYAVILAVLILVTTLAIAVAVIGSQRRVPAPFGPARNGSIFLATNGGDIVGIDATTSSSTLLVSGVDANAHPATSLRGSHVAFVRTDAAGHHVDVVDTDRGAVVRISLVPLDSIPHDFAWSPDDRQLAWISGNDLWMAHTDGSESHRIDVGMTVSDIAWRPPAGAEVVIRAAAANGLAGLYLMRSDGSNVRPITAIDGGEYGYTETDWSPDGTKLAYSSVPPAIVHVLTIDGLRDETIQPLAGASGTLFPRWSPDGTRLALVDWRKEGDGRVAIVSAGDLRGPWVDTGSSFTEGPDYVWSPDGTQILAVGWNSYQPWILDPLGGKSRMTSWILPQRSASAGAENTLLNVWQRLAR